MSNKPDYHVGLQTEFAGKLQAIQNEASLSLSPVGWFLLMSALCSLGEPSKVVFPKLGHSRSGIEGLGETYKKSFSGLSDAEKQKIQYLFRKFVDSLSYGYPSHLDLRD
jgi:hypothetical protein